MKEDSIINNCYDKREPLVDSLKGIGIILMVVGHAMKETNFIYIFHMSLFFYYLVCAMYMGNTILKHLLLEGLRHYKGHIF